MSVIGSEKRAPEPRAPQIEFRLLAPGEPLPEDVLCAVEFGTPVHRHADPRCVQVGLRMLHGGGAAELWRVPGKVTLGFDAPLRYAHDADFLAGAIELDEDGCGGLAATAQQAYETICRFQAASGYPHLLRIWNYFSDINRGSGDGERYKQFCAGRALGLAGYPGVRWPAATAIGRRNGSGTLQVYWLAGRTAGQPLENPRQVSAYQYPRQYGPAPPVFSRAMLVAGELLLISGTASILGHASHHPGDLGRQVEETLSNLASVKQRGSSLAPQLPQRLTAGSLLKIYLHEAAAAGEVAALLRKRLPPGVQYLILEADICRRELLVEIECFHGG